MVILPLVFSIIFVLSDFYQKTNAYFELIEELGCHDTQFRLTCGPLDAHIAILEATFSQNDSFLEPVNTSCGNPGTRASNSTWRLIDVHDSSNLNGIRNVSNGYQEVDFRHAINRRCSGVNHCSFILSTDYKPATRWGPGSVYLRYACMDDTHVTKSCRANLSVEYEGFVETPGYPNFYVGGRNCHWTLRSPQHQRVRVTFLDVSLRGTTALEKKCIDWLIIIEDGTELFSSCGDLEGSIIFESSGPELNVSLTTTSKKLFPKRGLLFHYKAIGCSTLVKPKDGYMVQRNETFAVFRCCIGFVFPDTFSRNRTLQCINENFWDNTLPDCIDTAVHKNETVHLIMALNNTMSNDTDMKDYNMVSDLILPITIMAILFLGNGIVLFIIYRLRNKMTTDIYDEQLEIMATKRILLERGEVSAVNS